jgi:hypothetical protein
MPPAVMQERRVNPCQFSMTGLSGDDEILKWSAFIVEAGVIRGDSSLPRLLPENELQPQGKRTKELDGLGMHGGSSTCCVDYNPEWI